VLAQESAGGGVGWCGGCSDAPLRVLLARGKWPGARTQHTANTQQQRTQQQRTPDVLVSGLPLVQQVARAGGVSNQVGVRQHSTCTAAVSSSSSAQCQLKPATACSGTQGVRHQQQPQACTAAHPWVCPSCRWCSRWWQCHWGGAARARAGGGGLATPPGGHARAGGAVS
jgi:hypothetical protein